MIKIANKQPKKLNINKTKPNQKKQVLFLFLFEPFTHKRLKYFIVRFILSDFFQTNLTHLFTSRIATILYQRSMKRRAKLWMSLNAQHHTFRFKHFYWTSFRRGENRSIGRKFIYLVLMKFMNIQLNLFCTGFIIVFRRQMIFTNGWIFFSISGQNFNVRNPISQPLLARPLLPFTAIPNNW